MLFINLNFTYVTIKWTYINLLLLIVIIKLITDVAK